VIEYLTTVGWPVLHLPTTPSSLITFASLYPHTHHNSSDLSQLVIAISTSHKPPKIYSMRIFLEKLLALFSLFSIVLSSQVFANGTAVADLPYGYSGSTGPNVWHKMSPQWKECATSKQQSPVNIGALTTVAVTGSTFLYPSSALFEIFYDAYALRVQLAPNNPQQFAAVLGGRRYKLVQFHFQLPGEHTLEEEYFPLEIHFVHESVDCGFFIFSFMQLEKKIDILFSTWEACGRWDFRRLLGRNWGTRPSIFFSQTPIERVAQGHICTAPCIGGPRVGIRSFLPLYSFHYSPSISSPPFSFLETSSKTLKPQPSVIITARFHSRPVLRESSGMSPRRPSASAVRNSRVSRRLQNSIPGISRTILACRTCWLWLVRVRYLLRGEE